MPDKEKKQKGRPVKCQNVEKVLRNKIIDRCNKPPKPKGSVGRPPIPCDKSKEKYENKISKVSRKCKVFQVPRKRKT